jgi:ribose/xylose/arabinose/galactoside ABC-type transport system permease subunit
METSLFSALPILLVLAAFLYAAVVGEKIHGSTGGIATLGVATTLLGLTMGWLLERFVPLTRGEDDWISFRSLRLEVAILFLFVAAFTFVAVAVLRRDATGQSHLDSGRRKFGYLFSLFVIAVGLPARAKLAAVLVMLLTKENL